MERDLRQTELYRTIEDHYRKALGPGFGRISHAADIAPSPDGRAIAFTGSRLDKLEGVPRTRICLAALPAGPCEEITAGLHDDLLPCWSPDGRQLAFVSDRQQAGLHQLHLLSYERLGEAVVTPWIDGKVEYLAWSPDGMSILLGVAEPGADIGDANGAGTIARKAEDVPSWMPAVKGGTTIDKWRRLWLYDVTTGTSRVLSQPGVNVWEAVWAGNERILAVISPAADEGAWYTAHLASIDVTTGHAEALYHAPHQLGMPAASPSGEYYAIIQALCSDRGMVSGDVVLFDAHSSAPGVIDTHGVDVVLLAWRDDRTLFYVGMRGLQTVFGDVEVPSGHAHELWSTDESSGRHIPCAAPLADGGFAVVLQSYMRYPELVTVRDGTRASVVSFGHEGSAYLIETGGTLEAVSWTAPDGLLIEGLLARPNTAGPHPLVVDVHGGPIWSARNCWWMFADLTRVLVHRGYAVLHPNPRGSMGRGQAFAEKVYGDMGGADSDDILAGIDALVDRGVVDASKVGIMGTSYGGFMSSWLITRTHRFAAAVSMSPVTEWRSMHYTTYFPDFDVLFLQDKPGHVGGQYEARSPVLFAHQARTPTLNIAGGLDEATPANQAIAFHNALLENGVESVLVIYPEEGHGVHRYPAIIDRCVRVVAWFERFMPA